MTGAKLDTTMVFRNFSLLSTIEELRHKNEEARQKQLKSVKEDEMMGKSEPH